MDARNSKLSSSNSLPSLLPSSPTSALAAQSAQAASPLASPPLPPPVTPSLSSASSHFQALDCDRLSPLPAEQEERLFDLDVFISRALKLCGQREEKREGTEEQRMDETKQMNVKRRMPKLPEHRPSLPKTPNS